jgi:hypothetical protein
MCSAARSVIAIVSLALGGCATQYEPYSFWNGGFTETEVQPGLFLVRFIGNAATTSDRSADFALLRAADLCLQRGKDYMLVGDLATQDVVSVHPVATTADAPPPMVLHSPASGVAVTCSDSHRDGAWDAKYLARAIRTKYSLS